MGLQVWLPLNRDINIIPSIGSFQKEGSVTFTEDADGWYKVTDSSHTSSRWGIYYDFDVRPNTTYVLRVYSKSTTGVACSIGFGSYPGNVTWPTVRDTNSSSTEKLTTFTLTTGQGDTRARLYLAMTPSTTVANNYVFYKGPEVLETINNQGLAPNVSVTNTNVEIDDNGKIGKCYSFNGTTSRLSLSSLTFSFPLSICAWVKFNNATDTNTEYIFSYNTDSGGTAGHNIGFGLYSGKLSIWHGGKVNSYSTDLSNNVWYHIAAVVTSSNYKLYLNGEEILSASYAHSSVSSKWITLGARSNSSTGGVGAALYFFDGYLNDVRFYNHALSAQEVKEISNGMVLRYTFNDISVQQLNNCYTNPTFDTSSSTGGWSHWAASGGVGSYGQNTDTNFIFREGQTYSHWFANSNTATSYYILYQSPSFSGGYRSLQCIVKKEDGGQIRNEDFYPGWNATVGSHPKAWDEIIPLGNGFYWCRCNGFQQDGSNNLVCMTVKPGIKVYVSEAYLENGREVCSNILFPSTTIYDCSGLSNNGVINDTSVVTSPDIIKYKHSLKNNQANNSSVYPLKGSLPLNSIDEITIAFWAKPSTVGYQDSGIFSTSNSSLPSDYQSTVCHHYDGKFACCNVSGAIVNLSVSNQFTVNQWHHYVFKYDGSTVSFYKDGSFVRSASQSGKLKPISSIFIFYSYAGNAPRTTSGNISDFRVYATALSADDIMDLYNNKL